MSSARTIWWFVAAGVLGLGHACDGTSGLSDAMVATDPGMQPQDDVPTSPDPGPADASIPELAAGSVTVVIPSEAAGSLGLVARVFYPATVDRRFPEGAPIMLDVPGGWGAGELRPEGVDLDVAAHGYIRVQVLLPGGQAGPGLHSGGEYDYRGADSIAALRDLVRFAVGEQVDQAGKTLRDHVPFALATNVGLMGGSNGGNLVIATLAEHGAELGERVDWFVAFESPIGDQYAAVELNQNGFYVPGSCTPWTCPWPGLAAALRFDPGGKTTSLAGELELNGLVYAEVDGVEGYDALGDLGFERMVPGPGPAPDLPDMHPSLELAQAIADAGIFGGGTAKPPWLQLDSSPEGVLSEFWHLRDGAYRVSEAHASLPGLLVMHLQTRTDHVQTQPDYPHARSHVAAWLEEGHAFVRLNPDAAYVALVGGLDAAGLPENAANTPVAWPGASDQMLPEEVGGVKLDQVIVTAGVLEMMDRVQLAVTAADLDAPLR